MPAKKPIKLQKPLPKKMKKPLPVQKATLKKPVSKKPGKSLAAAKKMTVVKKNVVKKVVPGKKGAGLANQKKVALTPAKKKLLPVQSKIKKMPAQPVKKAQPVTKKPFISQPVPKPAQLSASKSAIPKHLPKALASKKIEIKPGKPAGHSKKEKNQSTAPGEMAKSYDPTLFENSIYRKWLDTNSFVPRENKAGKRFVIPIPPPNVTGNLHLGHSMFLTLEDLMTRFHRMLGEESLYLPGTDHAGISTQMVVERHLAQEGKTREQLGREKFLEKAWEWKEKYHDIIVEQIKRMGTSCDWSRERFTMDTGMSRAVKKAFIDLYNENLIYKDNYLVNWCPRCKTVLSDLEVNYKEEPAKMAFIRYFVKAADKSIVVATVRPETMLGDTAVAVHPDDKRYKEFHGKTLILPILNREIPIILDESVDMNFGTGAVKVTPAHDVSDYEMYKRHNLEIISVIGKDGKMSKAAGKYAGLSVEQARENITEYLNNIGNLEDTKDIMHNVSHCERCDTKLEPYLSSQWFVRMKPLAQETLAQMQKEKLTFVPERFEKIFMDWLHSVHDWCISRQLWWGHQIPAYYCQKCDQIVVAEDMPQKCKCGSKEFKQDEDVLDTWFSSSLWPFSTLGWPLKTDDLQKFYPADVLETGYDIIFFWVMRMVFMSTHFMKRLPFHTVYLHGLVRDELGRKMSKSKGNGLDPLEVIDMYGADALRLSLSLGITPGNDIRLSLPKVEGNRNFVNKLWNASRFILMNLDQKKSYRELEQILDKEFSNLPSTARWILTRTQQVIKEVTDDIKNYRFGEAGSRLYEFTWGEFCDWYIEIAKLDIKPVTRDILQYCILTILKLWHPYIPFVTEQLWSVFEQKEMLISSEWPQYQKGLVDEQNVKHIRLPFQIITTVRNMRAEKNVEQHKRVAVTVMAHDQISLIKEYQDIIKMLAKLEQLTILKEGAPLDEAVSALVETVEVYMPLAGLIDLKAERSRLEAEIHQKTVFIKSLNQKLSNKEFLKKAPKQIVEQDTARMHKEQDILEKLKEQLKKVGK